MQRMLDFASKFLAGVVLIGNISNHVYVNGFYIPGVQQHSFQVGDPVEMKVNAMTSIHTQIPKDYYKLPYCVPENGPQMASENLGEFLLGNKIQTSPYVINMLTEMHCRVLCQRQLTHLEAAKLRLHIKYGYHHNWIIDNLPSANIGMLHGVQQKHYAGGFPIGFISAENEPYIYNHVNLVIDYFIQGDEGFRVVGFGVEPLSVKHVFQGGYDWDGVSNDGYIQSLKTCQNGDHLDRESIETHQHVAVGEKVLYTYDVQWKQSNVEWSSRWDVYLSENHLVPAQVHWYSIINSIIVVVFLSLLVISVIVRNLRRDIAAYNAILVDEEDGEENDETGWKLVHSDVFRPPTNFSMMYCVFIGSGVQLAVTCLFAIMFSAAGFLSPARRGSLMNALLAFYVLCGAFAGYVSSRLYKAFKGKNWQLCTVYTATLLPGIAFGIFLLFNIILSFLQSSASAPFLDIIIVAAMWCCVSIPLVFAGAYFGFKEATMEFPTVTSSIPRPIPESPIYLNPALIMTAAGVIPFAAAYVELFFIMTSLWMDQFYYVFGFTLVVYIIILITCAEITVLSVYYQLCAENHRWWWFSFFCSGSAAFYIFLYSCFWFKQLDASKVAMTYILYFGYMTLISFGLMLIFGSTGGLVSLWFVRKMFSSIKVD